MLPWEFQFETLKGSWHSKYYQLVCGDISSVRRQIENLLITSEYGVLGGLSKVEAINCTKTERKFNHVPDRSDLWNVFLAQIFRMGNACHASFFIDWRLSIIRVCWALLFSLQECLNPNSMWRASFRNNFRVYHANRLV